MAKIKQKNLFSWKEIEDLGDLERLRLVLDAVPDEGLMRKLEKERKNGRNDYPIRAVWNSILAGIIYQHSTIESLRRELKRNGQLRQMCGFNTFRGINAVPGPWVYTRFIEKLMENQEEIDKIFEKLIKELMKELEDFGIELAIDGKAVESYANSAKENGDRRTDTDANWGKKKYRGENKDGNSWEKVKSWFGYRLHLIVDANYELPVAFEVTKASESEVKNSYKMMNNLNEAKKERAEILIGDRGYDSTKLIKESYEKGIKTVIDMRSQWKGDDTRVLEGETNILYDESGAIYCWNGKESKMEKMAYGGFEKKRMTHKYLCPAKHYGYECESEEECQIGRQKRIKITEENIRRFPPLARNTYSWGRLYKKRTAVERVNSRLEGPFRLENHRIRGLEKMKLNCSLSLIIMLTMALARVKEKRREDMRSLVKTA